MNQGAIFDMDGLLFDTEVLYRNAWGSIPQEFGYQPVPELGARVCGTSGESLRRILRSYFSEKDIDPMTEEVFRRVQENIKKAAPAEKRGIHEIIMYFHENAFLLAVASSSPLETIEINLTRAGIRQYFDALISGADVECGKPAPDIYRKAAEQIECKPENCYVFEDGSNGIRAAVAAGCKAIMIPDLILPDDEMKSICTGIYPDLLAALEAIRGCAKR